jgi:hypothetical protein
MLCSPSLHAKVYGVSKKYDVPGLARRSSQLFPGYVCAFERDNPTLTDYQQKLDDVMDAAKVIYGSTQESDEIFKHAIVFVLRSMAQFLARHHEHLDSQSFRIAISSMDELAWDLLTVEFNQASFHCNACGENFVVGKKCNCTCAGRGICGLCSPLERLECDYCEVRGSCELL